MTNFTMRSPLAHFALGFAILLAGAALIAGPLNPPAGPVSSTYKTLNEVEPRTAVNSTNTPGNATYTWRITQPGSYYLTSNLVGDSGKSGIEITVPGVTLDLNGFTLQGGPSAGTYGVHCSVFPDDFTLRNGVISLWQTGASISSPGGSGRGSIVENVHFARNSNGGCFVSAATSIRNCVAAGNGLIGFSSASGSTLDHCIAYDNNGWGFSATGSMLTNCTARTSGKGFSLSPGSVATNCLARENSEDGFVLNGDCSVRQCTAINNALSGILVSSPECTVENNFCSGNQHGISATSTGCTIDSNRLNSNTNRGLNITGTDNIIIRNTAHTNPGGNYSIAAGNAVAPLIAVTASNNWPAIPNSNHPMANFGY